MRTRKNLRNVVVPLLGLFLLAGCGGGAGGTGGAANPAGDGGGVCTADKAGGTVTMAMGSQPRGLDPLVINGTPSTGGMEIAQVYDTLVSYDPGQKKYEPRVAQSLEPNATFDQWTLKLRPEVKFGNGDPLTAEAVKASMQRFQSENNKGTYRNLALTITDMTVADPTTLTFKLDKPWATFPFALANTPGMIVNTKVADQRGAGFLTNPAGAGVGPYEVTKYAPGEEIVLTAKKNYWGGPVCIETIRFVAMATDSGKYDAFKAGEIQAAWMRQPLTIDQTNKDNVPGINTFQNAANVLLLNSGVRGTNPPTKDVRIRRAIAHAVDVKAVDARENEGTGAATTAILGDKSPYFGGAKGLEHDRQKASALLNEAKAGGYNGKIRLACAKGTEETGLAIEGQLKAAGFDVAYETLADSNALVDRVIIKADYDVSCFGLNLIDEGLWATATNSLASTSRSNYGGLKDPRLDAALEKLRVASAPGDVTKAAGELQAAWNDAVPAVVLNAAPNKTIHSPKLRGLQPTSNSLVFFSKAYLAR